MRKRIKTLFLVSSFLLLFGCQSNEKDSEGISAKSPSNLEPNKIMIDSGFIAIGVSKSRGKDVITFDDKKSLNSFKDIFSSAVKEEGEVNMSDPEYYFDIIYDKNNKQSLYVWIGEKGQKSLFIKAEDTHTLYTVPEEITNKLIELVESNYK